MSDITPIRVGQDVPHFELETYDPAAGDFGKFSLEGAKREGRWTVLVFYPADFTFVCPTELADIAEKQDTLKALGCDIYGISTDTKFAHLAWRNSEKLLQNVRYGLAADPTGVISKMFGVYDGGSGLALRGTFIISPEGRLVSSEINFYNVGRDADELLRKVEANTYLVKHPEQACPAKWKPGSKTLTPSKDMVGKVYEALN
jgi:peroxiredoxin (alkyl hydroperoxide reductase subunit C)